VATATRRRIRRTQSEMFGSGEDLPLFSRAAKGTGQTAKLGQPLPETPRSTRPAGNQLRIQTGPTVRRPNKREPVPLDPELNKRRKQRLLNKLDKALGRTKKPATMSPEQRAREAKAKAARLDARRSYEELKRAILAERGLRATRDFKRSEIPADLYRPKTGKAPDEMAQFLTSHGFHFEGDDDLILNIQKRREAVVAAGRGRKANPQIVCMDIERDEFGRFARHRRSA